MRSDIKHHKGVIFTLYFINEEKETECCHISLVNQRGQAACNGIRNHHEEAIQY